MKYFFFYCLVHHRLVWIPIVHQGNSCPAEEVSTPPVPGSAAATIQRRQHHIYIYILVGVYFKEGRQKKISPPRRVTKRKIKHLTPPSS